MFKINTVSTDPNGRYVIISAEQNFGKFHIGSFYAPAVRSEQIEWFTNTSILILSNAIYGGDWNVTCKDIENSSKNVYYNDITAFDFFCGEHLIENATLSKTAYTFHHRGLAYSALLDKFLVSSDFPGIVNISTKQFTRSDHNGLVLEWLSFEHKTQLWKLNANTLTPKVVNEFSDM